MESLDGIKTAFEAYDGINGGFKNGHLVLLGGRPSMGKTAFALSLAQNVAIKQEGLVLYFSLEMSKQQLTARILSMKYGSEAVRNEEEYKRIFKVEEKNIRRCPTLIYDAVSPSLNEIMDISRDINKRRQFSLIVIDYLQLMHFEGESDWKNGVAETLKGFKKLAEELYCPILVLAQLSHEVELRDNCHPRLEDFTISYGEDIPVDEYLLLYREEYYNRFSDKKGIAELKTIHTATGEENTVELAFIPDYVRFEDLRGKN